MQSMVKAQCVSTENEHGVSKCICLSLICAVREKHLLMKGICLPLDPTGKWKKGGKKHSTAFEEVGLKSVLANTWNLSSLQRLNSVTTLLLWERRFHMNQYTATAQTVPGMGLEGSQCSSAPDLHLSCPSSPFLPAVSCHVSSTLS